MHINSLRDRAMVLLIALALAIPALAEGDPELMKGFTERVGEYLKLQKRLEGEAPKLPEKATPEQIADHHGVLSEAIVEARSGAAQGDVFGAAADEFRRVIKSNLPPPAKEAVKDGNPKNEPPTAPIRIAVNSRYPNAAPVSTIPPRLLLRLPQLPEPIQYRFVGKDLILLDSKADLIIDYLTNVIP